MKQTIQNLKKSEILNPAEMIHKIFSNKNLSKEIFKKYGNNLLLKHYNFYGDSLSILSINSSLWMIKTLLELQLVIGKDLYIPGIGLYSIPKEIKDKYSFDKNILDIPFEDASFLSKIIFSDGRIDYVSYTKGIAQVRNKRNKNKFTFYGKDSVKAERLVESVSKFIKIDSKQMIPRLIEYKGELDIKNIVEEYEKNKEYSILNYLKSFKMDGVYVEPKVLEDILFVVGYHLSGAK